MLCEDLDLSIIIPAYNVETYIKQCLDSVLRQSIENYEIILVNDGSTDTTQKICEEYTSKYSCIKLINQENKGLGAARNTGLKYANGKYIGFVDSDDFVKENMFSAMLNLAKKKDLDLVTCDVELFFQDANIRKTIENDLKANFVYNRKNIIESFFTYNVKGFAWNKIYKRYLFDGIRYEEGKYYEDIYPMFRILTKVKTMEVIKEPLYIYRQRKNNITSGCTLKHVQDFNIAIEKVNREYKNEENFNEELLGCFNILYSSTSFDLYIRYKKFKTADIYQDYREVYYNVPKYTFREVICNKYADGRYKINYLLWKIRLLPILKKLRYKLK